MGDGFCAIKVLPFQFRTGAAPKCRQTVVDDTEYSDIRCRLLPFIFQSIP